MKSILQDDLTSCFLCGRNAMYEPLDKHHIFGGPYRAKSEKYGLWVMLHHAECHIFGKRAAHQCRDTSDFLKREAQRAAMKEYGWDTADFIREFGKNYL